MPGWLAGEYRAVLFQDVEEVVAYDLFREQPDEVYLRQFFVARDRRSQGIGRRAVEILRSQVWSTTKRLTVGVLIANKRGVSFWRRVGYTDYCLSLEIVPGS